MKLVHQISAVNYYFKFSHIKAISFDLIFLEIEMERPAPTLQGPYPRYSQTETPQPEIQAARQETEAAARDNYEPIMNWEDMNAETIKQNIDKAREIF